MIFSLLFPAPAPAISNGGLKSLLNLGKTKKKADNTSINLNIVHAILVCAFLDDLFEIDLIKRLVHPIQCHFPGPF